jgi:hypothetical protein
MLLGEGARCSGCSSVGPSGILVTSAVDKTVKTLANTTLDPVTERETTTAPATVRTLDVCEPAGALVVAIDEQGYRE